MTNWKETTAYIFKNGAWQKVLVYNRASNKWSPAEFKVYSGASSHEEEPNAYGTTVIISNYTTEQNSHGTTVVIE